MASSLVAYCHHLQEFVAMPIAALCKAIIPGSMHLPQSSTMFHVALQPRFSDSSGFDRMRGSLACDSAVNMDHGCDLNTSLKSFEYNTNLGPRIYEDFWSNHPALRWR